MHGICFLVIKFRHVGIELSSSDVFSGGADICNCISSANEWYVIECDSMMVDKGLIWMEKCMWT